MFNLHVGIPGIVPDLLQSVAKAGILKADNSVKVLGRRLWQERLRFLVNAKTKHASFHLAAWSTAETTIAEFSTHQSVAISQHAMLGKAEHCFSKSKVLPYADMRMARVSEIFANVPLTLHLTIANQFDYLNATINRLPDGKPLLKANVVPSWSNLVRRIKIAAPNRHIVVWDFDQPQKVALAFIIRLLGTQDAALIDALDKHLSTIIKPSEVSPDRHAIPDVDHDLIDRLDAQYDLDLEALSRTEGVTLVLAESIPEDFHI